MAGQELEPGGRPEQQRDSLLVISSLLLAGSLIGREPSVAPAPAPAPSPPAPPPPGVVAPGNGSVSIDYGGGDTWDDGTSDTADNELSASPKFLQFIPNWTGFGALLKTTTEFGQVVEVPEGSTRVRFTVVAKVAIDSTVHVEDPGISFARINILNAGSASVMGTARQQYGYTAVSSGFQPQVTELTIVLNTGWLPVDPEAVIQLRLAAESSADDVCYMESATLEMHWDQTPTILVDGGGGGPGL